MAAAEAEATHALLGAGGFGVVVQPALAFPNTVPDPENAPNNVTKIMFRRTGYNRVVKVLPTVKSLLKNAGHRTTPSATVHTFNALPASLQSNIRKKRGFQSVEPDADIYTLRMPYLGIDVHELVEEMKQGGKEIRNRPVLVVLDQVVKLISQINTLVENGYIHGDVRDTNIMVHPLTGVLTLIDFDWLKPKDEFIDSYAKDNAFGFYSNPPESLFTGKRGAFVDYNGFLPPKIVSYVSDFYRQFTFCRDNYIGDIPKDTPEDEIESRCQQVLGEAIVEAINNKEFFDELGITSLKQDVWKTFDGFGLAWTLLTFFTYTYTSESILGDIDLFQRDLSTLITNEGVPYTEEQVKACANAIRRMIEEVLAPLSDFEYRLRIPIGEALDRATSIRDELAAVFADGVGAAAAAAAAAAVAEPVVKAVGGAGVGRRTRNRGHRRNHRTRRQRRN